MVSDCVSEVEKLDPIGQKITNILSPENEENIIKKGNPLREKVITFCNLFRFTKIISKKLKICLKFLFIPKNVPNFEKECS